MILKIPEIKNQIQILLKAMIYNKEKMQKVIDKYYDLKKGGKINGNTSINNSVNQVVENPQV